MSPASPIEEFVRSWPKRDNVANPATVSASSFVSHKHNLGLTIPAEVFPSLVFVEDDPKTGGAKHSFASRVIDLGAFIAPTLRVARRTA